MLLGGHNSTVSDPEANARGFALTLFGVLVLTPDTLLIRLIDIDPWTMNLWRGLLMSFSLTVCYLLVARGQALAGVKALGLAGGRGCRDIQYQRYHFRVGARPHTSRKRSHNNRFYASNRCTALDYFFLKSVLHFQHGWQSPGQWLVFLLSLATVRALALL